MKKPGQFPGSILFINFGVDVFMNKRIYRDYSRLVFVVLLLWAIGHEIFESLVKVVQLVKIHCITFATCFIYDSALNQYAFIGPCSHLVMHECTSGQKFGGIIRIHQQGINGCILGIRAGGLDCYVDIIARFGCLGCFNRYNVMFDVVRFHFGKRLWPRLRGRG